MQRLRTLAAATLAAGILVGGAAASTGTANAAPKPATTSTWNDPGLRLCAKKWVVPFCLKYAG